MNDRVAYQGERGAFGEQACRTFLPGWEPIPQPTFAAVADAVINGDTERGMIPIVNSIAGPVPGNAEIVEGSGLAVIAEAVLPVRMHLMARPGVTLEQIRIVTSHPMALKQCVGTLARLGLDSIPAANTAMAAKALIESGDGETAVIASEAAAELYGLTILLHDIHDRPDNTTTFAVLERQA
jgi:prephenate dehydratase